MITGLPLGFSIFLAVCIALIVYTSIKLGQMNQRNKLDRVQDGGEK